VPVEVLLVVLLSAALHAGWNALVKSGGDPIVDTVTVTVGVAAVGVPAIVTVLPLPAPASWPFLCASVALHLVYYLFLVLAYREGDLSLMYPVMRGSAPAITTVMAALIMGEQPSWGAWVGILMVSAGVLLLAADAPAPRSGRGRSRPLVYALLNAMVIVCYSLVDATGARRSGHALAYTTWMLTTSCILFSALALPGRHARIRATLRQHFGKAAVGGVCTIGAYGLALWAMTRVPIGPVAALRETSIVFSALLAVFYLKESISPLRYASIGVVTLGAIAIKAF
jgi:drug/metabolite transporter (DMT)-like permease